jgi:myo-inositol 2-dehydrogenase/D-chiro-inositol 1-dehydrogenase
VAWSTDLDAVLADPRVAAVVVATPPATHLAIIERCAASGRHVFCEKPLAGDADGAARATARAEEAGILLQVGFQMRFDPDLQVVHARVAAGELGAPRLLRASLRDQEPPPLTILRQSPGLLHDGAIHTLDLARWLMGEIVEVSAFAAVPVHPDVIAAGDVDTTVCVLRFASGALGVLDNGRVSAYGFDSGVEASGTAGTLRVERAARTAVAHLGADGRRTDHVVDFLERFAVAYERELEAFAEAVVRGEPAGAGGHDAVAAARLCDAAAASLRAGSAVALPPATPSGVR